MHWLENIIRHALTHYGYWAILGALLGENAGLPLPGGTTLMFASFLAHKTQALQITWVTVIGHLSLRFTRDQSGRTNYSVEELRGELHVLRQPSPWSFTSGWGERLKDAALSLLQRQ